MLTASATSPIGRLKVRYWFAKRAMLERLQFWVIDELHYAEQALQAAALTQAGIQSDPLQYHLRYHDEGALRMDPKPGIGLDTDPTEAVAIYASGRVESEGGHIYG